MTLVALSITWTLGILVGATVELPAISLALFATASVLTAVGLKSKGRPVLPGLLAVLVVLGAARAGLQDRHQSADLKAFHGRQELEFTGTIVTDPEPAGRASVFRLAVETALTSGALVEVEGLVLVRAMPSVALVEERESPYFRYGERVVLSGRIAAPPELEEFDYPLYLARQGIVSVMEFPRVELAAEGGGVAFYRWLYRLRQRLADGLERAVPEPQASFGQAVLLGIRDNLPDDLVDDFRRTGTSHLLAISGLHVGVLLGMALAAAAWVFGRRGNPYILVPLVLIWLYALMSGMSPSATRAVIMGTVYLAALALGRPRSVLPALGLAAALMLAVDPQVLFSISFQLSFAAMAGIATLAEPIRTRLGGGGDRGGLFAILPSTFFFLNSTAMTLAATIATLPLLAFYFQQLSLVGIPTTLLTLPALPFVLVSSGATAALGTLGTAFALPLGWIVWLSSAYVTTIVELAAALPSAAVDTGRVAPWLVAGYYLAIAAYLFRRRSATLPDRPTRRMPQAVTGDRPVPWWALLSAVSAAALLWTAALTAPDGWLRVVFADVGQGDSIFISTPSGRQVLVDGGPRPLDAVQVLGERLPFWDRSLDVVVLTHPHADHMTGLIDVLDRYDVAYIVERPLDYASPGYVEWREAVESEEATVVQARAGQRIDLGDGVVLHILSPPQRLLAGTRSDVNNASVALRLTYGDVSFLLSGDLYDEGERVVLSGDVSVDSDVLKVGHQGSRTSSSGRFVSAVSPSAAVISVGEDNRFGHPHQETIETLLRFVPAENVYTTSDNGDVEFTSDGVTLRVKTER